MRCCTAKEHTVADYKLAFLMQSKQQMGRWGVQDGSLKTHKHTPQLCSMINT